MEELRSTEILDREIQEDARRKAEKILKTVDADCEAMLAEAKARIDATRLEKKAEYAERLAVFERDTRSSIPLEKKRLLVSFIETSVRSALDARFAALDADGRLAVYGSLLERYAPVFDRRKVTVRYAGLDPDGVTKLVARIFGAERVLSVSGFSKLAASESGCSDGVHIESEDRSVLCRASVEEVTSILLEDHRQELAEALFGGRLPS